MTANVTSVLEEYIDINKLPDDARYFKYNYHINGNDKDVASHMVIEKYIKKFGKDYRFETDLHPIKELQDRKVDNISVGRIKH